MIKLRDTESTCIQMEQLMLGIGLKTSKMALEKKHGLMEPDMKVIIDLGSNTEKDTFHGQMAQVTKENSRTITQRVKEHMFGLMEGALMVNGQITKWKEKEFLDGQMVESTLENIDKIRKKGWVTSNGKMEGCITDNGKMGYNMVMDSSLIQKEISDMGFGTKADDQSGQKDENLRLK